MSYMEYDLSDEYEEYLIEETKNLNRDESLEKLITMKGINEFYISMCTSRVSGWRRAVMQAAQKGYIELIEEKKKELLNELKNTQI